MHGHWWEELEHGYKGTDFSGYVARLDAGGSGCNLDIKEQFLVVTLHARMLVGVAGVEDLRERF